jgi:hypothetical protein
MHHGASCFLARGARSSFRGPSGPLVFFLGGGNPAPAQDPARAFMEPYKQPARWGRVNKANSQRGEEGGATGDIWLDMARQVLGPFRKKMLAGLFF